MEMVFDAVVVGSGPSGATAAFFLAKEGYSVAIIEKEKLPRYKTCGGGLIHRGKKLLPFDISSAIDKEFTCIEAYFSNQNLHLKSERPFPVVSMVMRDKLDQCIVNESVNLGVKLFEKHKLIHIEYKDELSYLTTDQGVITARFVIGADGALSPTAKLAGWIKDTRFLVPALEYEVFVKPEKFEKLSKEVRFDIDFLPKGYAWNFPKKNHLSLGVVAFSRSRIDLKKYYQDYIHFLGIEASDIVNEEAHGFQIPVTYRSDGFVRNNVFLIGDAAGFADPITAEGISNAIYSGKIVAESIIESKLVLKEASLLYDKKLKEKLLPELKTATFLANLFYNQPKIRNFIINKSGNKFAEYLTAIFVGEKSYPNDLIKSVKTLIKKSVFN
jgi:geranylgeranyl reductase family protein